MGTLTFLNLKPYIFELYGGLLNFRGFSLMVFYVGFSSGVFRVFSQLNPGTQPEISFGRRGQWIVDFFLLYYEHHKLGRKTYVFYSNTLCVYTNKQIHRRRRIFHLNIPLQAKSLPKQSAADNNFTQIASYRQKKLILALQKLGFSFRLLPAQPWGGGQPSPSPHRLAKGLVSPEVSPTYSHLYFYTNYKLK